ncbi:hypothetical protein [Butyrivibrio sp. NC2002]
MLIGVVLIVAAVFGGSFFG